MDVEEINRTYNKIMWHMKDLAVDDYQHLCGCIYSNLLITDLTKQSDEFKTDGSFDAEKFKAGCETVIDEMTLNLKNILNLAAANYVAGNMSKNDNVNEIVEVPLV